MPPTLRVVHGNCFWQDQSGSAGLVHALQGAEMGDQELQQEVNFLILHALRSGPCGEAADLLEQQLAQHGLLPTRTDVTGKQSPCRATAPESVQIWLGCLGAG